MIELLIVAGVLAALGLVAFGGAFLLHQRRSGTVRAVLFPRRSGISRPRLRRRREEAEE
jgi:hypothetical protein